MLNKKQDTIMKEKTFWGLDLALHRFEYKLFISIENMQ